VYKRIAKLLDGKRVERDRYIRRVSQTVFVALKDASVTSEITGRAKHIFSIWKKMQRKGIGFSQVHDVRAIRILVPTIKDCYTTLGVIHGLWRTIPNEFDDYIANPKPNGYRSLHTAVIGPEGKVLEVQVRTNEMHDEAELGVCAHWRYKQSDRASSGSVYEEKIEWLRQALRWHDESGDSASIAETLRFDSDYDRVFVFTPKGDIVNLMHGATPLDFAYHVHTQIGHRCRGARVNGSLVPLNQALNTGDRVHIITADQPVPKREWLNADAKWVVTSRAKAHIIQWFKAQKREDNLAAGRALLEKAFKRLAMNALDYKRIARKVQCPTVEDMYVAVGSGELAAQGVVAVAQSLMIPEASQKREVSPADSGQLQSWGGTRGRIHRAGCCQPEAGDRVAGFVTRARGVSVHRLDCSRWLKLVDMAPDRVVEVRWDAGQISALEVVIEIRAYDRKGLLRDVTETLSDVGANMISVNTQTDRRTQLAYLRLELEVSGLAVLDSALAQLGQLPNVISAERINEVS
jgi:GTP pyrophosphokinase